MNRYPTFSCPHAGFLNQQPLSVQRPRRETVHGQQREDLQVLHTYFPTTEPAGVVFKNGQFLFLASLFARALPARQNSRWICFHAYAPTFCYWGEYGQGHFRR